MSDLLKDADLGSPIGHDASVRHLMTNALKDLAIDGQPVSVEAARDVVERCYGALKEAGFLPSGTTAAPHPETVATATVLARRLCRDDALAMEWSDLLVEETRRVRAMVDGLKHPHPVDNAHFNEVLRITAATTDKLACILGTCARWGTPEAVQAALRTLQSLAFRREPIGGFTMLIELRDLPASIAFYAMLVGAVDRRDYALVRAIFDLPFTQGGKTQPAITLLPMQALITSAHGWKFIAGYGNRHLPHSEPLFRILQPLFGVLNIEHPRSQVLFDDVEALVSLDFGARRLVRMEKEPGLWFFTPIGEYLLRGHRRSQSPLDLIPADPAVVAAGLIGGTRESARRAAEMIAEHAQACGIYF